MSDYKPSPEVEKAASIINYATKSKETKSLHLLEAKINAVKKNLMQGDQVNYKLLEDQNIAKKYQTDLVDSIKNSYQKTFGINLDEVEKRSPGYSEQLLQTGYGINEGIIGQLINQYKSDLTPLAFANIADQQLGEITKQSIGMAQSKIKTEHLDDIVKYTKIDSSLIDKSKIGHEETGSILTQYLTKDSISEEWLKKQHFYKGEKDKKK
jgi:hypothetical protein